MTFWWIAKCGLDWLSLHAITWRTCQNPVRKPPTVLTVSFSGGNLSVDFTFSFQPRTKSSHKFVWLVTIKTNETFSVFSVFCKFFILKLQKNSKTGGTENEQEDAWIKKNTTYCASFYTVSYFVLKKYLIAKNISLLIIVAYFSFYRFFFFIAFFCFKAFHNSSCLLFFMIFINVFFYLFLPVLQTKTVVFFKHFTMSLFFLFSFFFFGLFLSFCVTVSFVQAE